MVTIVSRQDWGARNPRRRHTIRTPTPRLWLHHTAGSEPDGPAGLRRIQNFHMNTRGWSDIAYSFVVDRRATIFEGRGAGVAGGHTAGDNTTSHAICVIGNYDNERPTSKQLAAIAELIHHGREAGWWHDLTGGHRDAPGASTACPGRHLYEAIPQIRTIEEDEVTPEQMEAIARRTADLIQTEGLSPRTKDDIALRVWNHEVYSKPAGNRLHDADVRTKEIAKALDEHADFDVDETETS